jgi:hypothetical protein
MKFTPKTPKGKVRPRVNVDQSNHDNTNEYYTDGNHNERRLIDCDTKATNHSEEER